MYNKENIMWDGVEYHISIMWDGVEYHISIINMVDPQSVVHGLYFFLYKIWYTL
jgi:hypothetical protein